MEHKRLGLIVNPIAGIGGRVGLKGSDGKDIQERARILGAIPLAGERAVLALERLLPLSENIELLVPPEDMGETIARRCGFSPLVIPTTGLANKSPTPFPFGRGEGGNKTTPEDTFYSARTMREAGVDLILFSGGDGTARDIYNSIGNNFPVLGIPAGVKIQSAVFATTPRNAGELAAEFLQGKGVRLLEAEVVDLDEDAYRLGQIVTRLYGYLKIPYRREVIQNQKVPSPASSAVQMQGIATDIIEQMKPDLAYILGPGTTTRSVAEQIGLPKTLVGVDIITKTDLLAADVGERQILDMMERRPMGLIITPTGGQGFLLGRGNQQISPDVIRRVSREDMLVICLASKIAALQGRPLLVDSGDHQVDRLLVGYLPVISGYHEIIIYKVEAPDL
jgi:predicted polyphosphate/ATP-dependent NAD kinase